MRAGAIEAMSVAGIVSDHSHDHLISRALGGSESKEG
jgi:hypothetical protein